MSNEHEPDQNANVFVDSSINVSSILLLNIKKAASMSGSPCFGTLRHGAPISDTSAIIISTSLRRNRAVCLSGTSFTAIDLVRGLYLWPDKPHRYALFFAKFA